MTQYKSPIPALKFLDEMDPAAKAALLVIVLAGVGYAFYGPANSWQALAPFPTAALGGK